VPILLRIIVISHFTVKFALIYCLIIITLPYELTGIQKRSLHFLRLELVRVNVPLCTQTILSSLYELKAPLDNSLFSVKKTKLYLYL
jgi:hypothetical protein